MGFDEYGSAMSKLKDIEGLFNGRHFDREVIVLCVRWYLRYELSFRGIAEMMAERGLSLAHTTIMRWVKRFTPEFAKRWNRLAVTAGQSWRVDETYVKIRGKWAYDGKDSRFQAQHQARRCRVQGLLREGDRQRLAPESITLDGYAASHRAVREMKADGLLPKRTKLRSSKYLNNLIEQDHRHIKSRVNVMLGFKRFRNAVVTISGIVLMHRIRKDQFDLTNVRLKETTAPAVWMAVLSAP
ncbi:IS6 family transposase [Paraburkholderia madseniana]|uniref:DDE-type integrase/transposase/recombinase n=1 Tax=Paraburkholderia madseniana TaxID=2599607 RepID=UPI001558ACB2|nr:DDE-type integrase/transposase/recombinase [Paraburkholderia madseniana]NPT64233.1 DDE-type integrase/transposase/recombinase [Paraburkholderia madseniana]